MRPTVCAGRWSGESLSSARCVRTIGGVIRQHMPEVPFPQYHDMVEALASDRANQPFNMTVLPWRTWNDRPVANAHGLQATGDRGAIGGVAVSDEVARCLIPW